MLKPEILTAINSELVGTSGVYNASVCESLAITEEELLENLEAAGVFVCSVCDWYCSIDDDMADADDEVCWDCAGQE